MQSEFWSDAKAEKRVILWCDKLKNSSDGVNRKRKCISDIENNSDNGSSKQPATKRRKKTVQEDREERVVGTIEKLKKKHSSDYTPVQIRIWSEMIVGGIHASLKLMNVQLNQCF